MVAPHVATRRRILLMMILVFEIGSHVMKNQIHEPKNVDKKLKHHSKKIIGKQLVALFKALHDLFSSSHRFVERTSKDLSNDVIDQYRSQRFP